MTLKTTPALTAQAAQAAEKPEAATPEVAPTLVALELAIYQRYTRGGVTYTAKDEKGRPISYRFTVEQARVLLREVEEGTSRPIWKRSKAKPVAPGAEVEQDKIVPFEPAGVEARVDVGTDEELHELLGEDLDDFVEVN